MVLLSQEEADAPGGCLAASCRLIRLIRLSSRPMTSWRVAHGDLLDTDADGLLCSANPSLNLSGGVGGAFSMRFGPEMQTFLLPTKNWRKRSTTYWRVARKMLMHRTTLSSRTIRSLDLPASQGGLEHRRRHLFALTALRRSRGLTGRRLRGRIGHCVSCAVNGSSDADTRATTNLRASFSKTKVNVLIAGRLAQLVQSTALTRDAGRLKSTAKPIKTLGFAK
jgi:hypothetical protein